MSSDQRDAVFSVESPDLEEDGSAGGGGGGGGTDSEEDLRENEDVVITEPNEADEDDPEYEEDLNSPSMVSTAAPLTAKSSSTGTVTVALPAGSAVPVAAIPVDSEPKWHRMTEIVHQRPPIDDSRRLFQRLWTDEDEIELLRGFLDYIASHRGNSSHPPDTAPFYEQIKSKLQLDFNKNQLVEKLRRLKKKYRNVMSKFSSGKEVFFKSPHDQATFDISRKIWNQTGKIIGFEDNTVMDFEEANNHHHTNGNDMDSENGLLEKKVAITSGSRKRSRSRIGKMDEDKPVTPSDVPIPNVNLNDNAAADFIDGKNLGGLIEETVKNCVSPVIKEMMNGTTGMMMTAMGGFPGAAALAFGVFSPTLMPSPSMNLGFGVGGGGKALEEERWRRQRILELEVYSRRLELVQEQIRATVHELKTMPNEG